METAATQLSDGIREHELERHVLELETDGLTVVPPSVTGVSPELLDRCTEVLLARFTEMTDCPISVENGPEAELAWPKPKGGKRPFMTPEDAPPPTQMLIQQLLQQGRCFRDLFVNPVVDALVDHLIGQLSFAGGRARRLSSTNSFVKWQGEYGYGETLGLHPDQGANPLPWGSQALTANATWCLTEYTKADGALAYVPGSHRANSHPTPAAVERATAVECERGSVIVWPGSTWHGAYPKLTKGLRLNAVAYYRHQAVLPQENLTVTMAEEPWDDCDDPDMMRELIGFDDVFPYVNSREKFAHGIPSRADAGSSAKA